MMIFTNLIVFDHMIVFLVITDSNGGGRLSCLIRTDDRHVVLNIQQN